MTPDHAAAATIEPSRTASAVERERAEPAHPMARSAPPDPSRRRAFGLTAARLFGGLAGLAGAGASLAPARRAAASPPSVAVDADPGSLIRRLVDRLTFGFTPAELALAQSMGYQGYLEYHLNLTEAGEDPAVAAAVTAPAGTGLFPWLNATNLALQTQASMAAAPIIASVTDATIFRATFSKRQLFEKMVEFWSDHFNIDVNTDQCVWLKLIDDRSVIRPNAMGSFEALVNASARSAAMLNYLDNDVSRNGFLNENYGRELLELHTMSVASGYTQNDVIEVARCLTGWTWWNRNPPQPNEPGTFRYNTNNHDNGPKSLSPLFNLANPNQPMVIGANGGQTDAQTVINILVAHPATADFIATKLCRRFMGEDCPRAVVDAVKAAYLASTPKGDVKNMLRAMFDPNVLASASLRLKRPFHLIASALRATLPGPANVTAFATLKNQYRNTGHLPFNWSPPDGYPDSDIYWSGLLLPRWNFGASLMTNGAGTNGGINGVVMDAAAVNAFFPSQTTRDQVVDKIDATLFGGTWPASEKNAVRSFLPGGTLTATNKRDALGLALASPSFQYY